MSSQIIMKFVSFSNNVEVGVRSTLEHFQSSSSTQKGNKQISQNLSNNIEQSDAILPQIESSESDEVFNNHNGIFLRLWHVMTNMYYTIYSKIFDNTNKKLNIQPINTIPKSYTVGFPNIENSSYMSSALRSLFCLPPFISFIEEYVKVLIEVSNEQLYKDNIFMYYLNALMQDLKEGKCDRSKYEYFCEYIFDSWSQSAFQQEGITIDVIYSVISSLEENVHQLVDKAEDTQDQSFIEKAIDISTRLNDLFYSTFQTRYKCPTCPNIRTNTDDLMIINIYNSKAPDVNDKISYRNNIEFLLHKHFSKYISKKKFAYIRWCDKCNGNKLFMIEEINLSPSEILILNFNRRSEITNIYIENNRLVTYPTNKLVINLHYSKIEKKVQKKTYLFSSVICQHGGTIRKKQKSMAKVINNYQDIPHFMEYYDDVVKEVIDVKEVNEKYTESICEKYTPYLLFYYSKKEEN